MAYIQAKDAPAPRYIVTVMHTEHESSVSLFIDEQAARVEVKYWQDRHAEVYLGELLPTEPTVTAEQQPTSAGEPYSQGWLDCCRAANRLADLVCSMYHPKDEQARKTWPTATWAEMIAAELNIPIPGRD
jgi:hypothetical protein